MAILDPSGLHLGFFGYGYPLLESTDTVEGVALASLVDIGLMKLDALIDRGSRKDFYDVYWIARNVSIPDLLRLAERKYPYVRDFELMALESLALFDNADRDLQPDLLVDLSWEQVREFFVAQTKAIGQAWLWDENEGRNI